MALTNQTKNTASVTNKKRGGGDVTWNSSDPATWDESPGTWDAFMAIRNQSKNTASVTNTSKS